MNRVSFDRFGRAWADAMCQAPIDERRSLVRLLEVVAAERERAQSRRHRAPSGVWLAVAATLVCALGVGGYVAHQRAKSPLVAGAVVPGAWLETRRDQRVPMHFNEGSEVVVAEASRVRVNSVDPRGASVLVERGTVRANIVHRKDTRWAFAAGPFNVRVTGTVLSVDWHPERQAFSVTVDQGSVVAEGPLLGVGRVIASGQSCAVMVKTAEVRCTSNARMGGPTPSVQPLAPVAKENDATEALDVTALPLVEEVEPEATDKGRGHRAAAFSSVRDLEKVGKYVEALSVAEGIGLPSLLSSGTAEELFCLSRLGRYLGKPSLSQAALVRIRDRFVKTKEAAIAAFLLGRQSAPLEAARWFSLYLAEQPDGAFAREASGRLVESLHLAGQFAQAQAAAHRYLAAYPAGPHAGFAKSLLATP